MTVVDDLKAQINSGHIKFDPTPGFPEKLRKELLGEAIGVNATARLQALVLAVSRLVDIKISSIVRTGIVHGEGRSFDVGNEDVAAILLPQVAKDDMISLFKIDEIIFDAAVVGETDRNKWNYDGGTKHVYDIATLNNHKNHIHFAVKAG